MTDIFSYNDYKKLLLALINDSASSKFRPALIAAMGCQKSFFSQVLNGSIHLTPDHAARAVEFLGFDDNSAEYFMNLVNLARAGSPVLKARIRKKLESLRSSAIQPSERLKWPSIKEIERQSTYYSSYLYSAVHMLVSIKQFQSVEAISERLNVPPRRIQEILHWLQRAKLISKTSSGFEVIEYGLHLSADSPLIETHHMQWRSRAQIDVQRADKASTHYSAVFAMSHEDFAELRSLAMNFIQSCAKKIAPSPPEEVYALCLDLFSV
jgi:uncharacterized protein (TIGR02147 family)